MGSTSFLGFSYPNQLLVFLNLLFLGNLFIYFIFYLYWYSYKVYFVCDSASEFEATGSTSFLGFSYPNLLLIFLKKKIVEVGNRTAVNVIVKVSSNRGARKNKMRSLINHLLLTLIIVVGRNRTTVNAIVRVPIYHRLYNNGTVKASESAEPPRRFFGRKK